MILRSYQVRLATAVRGHRMTGGGTSYTFPPHSFTVLRFH